MSILLLTGPSGSGKTTLGRSLCNDHGGTFVSERALCHDLAVGYGFERTRGWLKAVGAVQVGHELAARTAQKVRASHSLGGLVVVDGVYYPEIVREISEATSEQARVAFVDAPQHVRLGRVAERTAHTNSETIVDLEAGRREMEFLDGVKAGFGIEDMRGVADWQLDGTQPTAMLQAEVEQLLQLAAPISR